MATAQEAVRRLTIQSQTVGVTQSTAELNALAQAHGNVAVASNTTERATLSLDTKFASIERRYNTALRNQQDYAKIQSQVNAAVAQNPALQDRANAVLAAAADRYGQVTGAQKAFGVASQTVNLQIAALAGNLGVTGQVLSAFGPLGFASAVGIGAVSAAFGFLSDQAHMLAEKARDIKEFAEQTGLSTTQFQALRSEAGKFGIDSQTLATGLSKFTSGFQELRMGSGDLLTQIRRINPALADQMQQATDSATAFTLFGKAVQATDNIFQRNALLKAGLGKGGATYGAFFDAGPDVAKLTDAFAAAGKGIDENLINKLRQLQLDIDKTKSAANTVFAGAFGTSTLEAEKKYAELLLDIAKTFKLISSFNFPQWLSESAGFAAKLVVNLTPLGTIVSGLVALRGLVAAGAAANDNKPVSMASFQSPANSYSSFQSGGAAAAAVAPKTAQADLADIERRIALLGAAATATEKYDAAVAKLKLGQDGLTLSEKDFARAQSALQLDRDASTLSARVGALGQAATVTDLLAQKTNALAKAQLAGAGLSPAEIANQIRLTKEQASGAGAINSQVDALKVQVATVGMSAGAAAEYAAVQTKLNEAIRNGTPLTTQQEADLRKAAAALRDKTQAAAEDAAKSKVAFDIETMFLSDSEKAIAQVNYRLHGSAWRDYTDDALSNMTRLRDGLSQVKDLALDFTKSLVQGLLQGKSGMDALRGAATQLASKLADKALTDLFSGNFLQAGIEGIAAIGASIFGNSGKKQKEEEDRRNAAAARTLQYQQDAAAAGRDTSTIAGAIADQNAKFQQERIAENQAGDDALSALYESQNARRLALIKDFNAREIAEEKAKQDALEARQLTAQDRLFAAANDNSTLQGQLAALDRQFAKERVDEMKAGGEALNDLVAAQEAERAAVIKKTNDDLLAYVRGVAKTIQDYLTQLKTGSSSILAPEQRLAAAQANFSAQLASARTGDHDALDKITQVAQVLLDQAKGFYASGAGYADIYNQVTSQLGNLAGGLGSGSGMARGGIVPGYAGGGVVGNGVFNVDSVRARYAGGGDIALAGGEHVTRASMVNASTLPTLNAINQTGRVPGNDNGQHFADLGQTLVRAMAGISVGELNAAREDNAALRALLVRLIKAVEENKPKPARPAARVAS